jgi:hypothetical protein
MKILPHGSIFRRAEMTGLMNMKFDICRIDRTLYMDLLALRLFQTQDLIRQDSYLLCTPTFP